MKTITLICITLIFSISAFAQKNEEDNLTVYDISEKIDGYKIFSINSDNLINIGKTGYNIDYIMELFYASMSGNDVEVKITSKAKKILSRVLKKKKYLTYRRKVLQNIIIEGENIAKVYVLGKNTHDPNRLITYYIIDNEKYSGCVYQSISTNNGTTWQSPTIAIKHNKIPLRGWDIIDFKSKLKAYGLVTILTDKDNYIYISTSSDVGNKWSYPHKLSNDLRGRKFHTSTYKKRIAIIFEAYGKQKENVYLLLSNTSELARNKLNNIVIKVSDMTADNISWKVNHISEKTIFIIKTSYNDNQTQIDGYLLSVNKDIK